MRSKEIADFTGVTVRALRHYHALGILPEPARGDNGYREYSVKDAVTVLRIKRLSSMGFPLAKVKEMLSAEPGAPTSDEAALKELEASLSSEIDRLEQQRAAIRMLLENPSELDVPQAYGEHFSNLRKHGASEQLIEVEKASVLLIEEELAPSPDRSDEVRALFKLISDSGTYEDYIRLDEDFLALPATATDAQKDELFERLANWFDALLVAVNDAQIWEGELEDSLFELGPTELIDAYETEILNDAQLEVFSRIAAYVASGNAS